MYSSFSNMLPYTTMGVSIPIELNYTSFTVMSGDSALNMNIYTNTSKTIPNYDIYTFKGNSRINIGKQLNEDNTKSDISKNILFYAVGGGGGGGIRDPVNRYTSGGGGAGGVILGNIILNSSTVYNIVIGKGGNKAIDNTVRGVNGNPTYIDMPNFPQVGGGGGGGSTNTVASNTYNKGGNGSEGGSGGGSALAYPTIAGTIMAAGEGTNVSGIADKYTCYINCNSPYITAFQPNSYGDGRNGAAGTTQPGCAGGGAANQGGTSFPGCGIILSANHISQLYNNTVIGIGGGSDGGGSGNTTWKNNTGDGGLGSNLSITNGYDGVFIMAVPKSTFTCLNVTSMTFTMSDAANCIHECWFKTNQTSMQYLFFKSTATYACGINANGYPFVKWNTTTVSMDSTSGIVVNDDKWHHVALVVKTGVASRILIDGIYSVNTTFGTVSAGSVRMFSNSTTYTNQFVGQVYNIRTFQLTSLITSSYSEFISYSVSTPDDILNGLIKKNCRLILDRVTSFVCTDRTDRYLYSITPEIDFSQDSNLTGTTNLNRILLNSIPCQGLGASNRLLNYNSATTTPNTITPTGTGYNTTTVPYSIEQP